MLTSDDFSLLGYLFDRDGSNRFFRSIEFKVLLVQILLLNLGGVMSSILVICLLAFFYGVFQKWTD